MDRDRDVARDIRRDRDSPSRTADESRSTTDSSREDSSSRRTQEFEISFTVPALYSSSAVSPSTEEPISDRPDFHVAPEVMLRWSRQFSQVKLAAGVGASIDRYAREHEADIDTFLANAKVSWTDGRSDAMVPYLSYVGTIDYLPVFATRDATRHDFASGVTFATGWRKDGRAILARDATDPGDRSLSLDLRGGRRIADPIDLQHTFVTATLDYSHVFSREWSASVSPRVRVRWYDPDIDEHQRRDIRVGATLKAVWTPEWLTRLVRRGEIDFIFNIQRNYSTEPDSNYTLWDIGPTLALNWKF
jgi:hypothetical protein